MSKGNWVEISSLDPPDVVIPKLGSIIYNALYETGVISPLLCTGARIRLHGISLKAELMQIEWEGLDDRAIISRRASAQPQAAEGDQGPSSGADQDAVGSGVFLAAIERARALGRRLAVDPYASPSSEPESVDASDHGAQSRSHTFGDAGGGGCFSGGGASDSWDTPADAGGDSADASSDASDGGAQSGDSGSDVGED